METIGDRIKRLREAVDLDITQEELANRLKALGIEKADRTQIVRWESGKTKPMAGTIMALAKIFGVTSDYLLEGLNGNNMSVKPNERAIIEAVRLNPRLAHIIECTKDMTPEQIDMACRVVCSLIDNKISKTS